MKLSDWFKPYLNKTMKGIKYPSMVTWHWRLRNDAMEPALSWKCNM